MAPEEISDAGPLKKLQMLQRPDVLAHGGANASGHSAGERSIQRSPMAEAIDPGGPGEWHITGYVIEKVGCVGLSGIRSLPG